MICEISAYVQTSTSGAAGPQSRMIPAVFPCIMLLVFIGFWGLVIFGLVKLIKYLSSAGREQKLIRMELSKLDDEVGQIRQELKGTNETLEKETDNG